MESLCYNKCRWWRLLLFGLWLTNIVIAILVVTVTIPSRLAPYFLLLMFVIVQIISVVRKRKEFIEQYYLEVNNITGVEGRVVKCTLDLEQLLELDFKYEDGCILVDEDIEIEVDKLEGNFKKLYLFDITFEEEGHLVIIKEYDNNLYVFKKENADA